MVATGGSARVSQEAEGEARGKHVQGLHCGFCRKEWERRGRQAEVTLDNVGGVCGTGAIPSCLVPGPG